MTRKLHPVTILFLQNTVTTKNNKNIQDNQGRGRGY